MSEKTLKLVAGGVTALALVYLAVALLGGGVGSAGPAPAGALEEALGALDPASLDSVLVEGPEGERVALRRSPAGPWTVNGLPADFEAIVRLREELDAAGAGSPVAANPANHARLGVAEDSSWLATLHAGSETVRLRLGGSGPSFGSGYARLADAPEVYALEGGLAGTLKRAADDWRDRTILTVDTAAVRTLIVEREGEEVRLVRTQEGWRREGAEGDLADSTTVRSVLGELADLQAMGFPDEDQDVSAETGGGAEEEVDRLRRLVALGAAGDTLASLRLEATGVSTMWHVRTTRHTLVYELSTYMADQLVPAAEELGGAGGG